MAMALAQITIVTLTAFTLLFYDKIGFLNAYVAWTIIICNIFIITLLTKASSVLTTAAAQILELLKKKNEFESVHDRKVFLDPIREIRIYIGNFYFVDPGTLLNTFDVVLSNLISMLLSFR